MNMAFNSYEFYINEETTGKVDIRLNSFSLT